MEPVFAARRHKRINKKNKLHIVFDETARREFLTGFRKRKLQRKKAAEEQLQQQLKAERKRIKQESKEQYKKLVQSYKPIPELEEQLAEEYNVENSTVSILELDGDLLAETNFLIGRNRGQVNNETEVKDEVKEEPQSEEEELPGMEITAKKIKAELVSEETNTTGHKTKKEVKKELKQQATKTVKTSKAFKRKNEIERIKQKKKSMRLRKQKLKTQARSKKGKKQKRLQNRHKNK